MDYPGFGLSDGLHGYIPNFDQLVDDVVEQYAAVKGSTIFEDYFPSLVSVIDNISSLASSILNSMQKIICLYCRCIH
jgi:alpha-beta hydrolase superfamily lysophospholipase